MGQRRVCTSTFWVLAGVCLADGSNCASAAEPDTPPDGSPRSSSLQPATTGSPAHCAMRSGPSSRSSTAVGRMVKGASSSRRTTVRALTASGKKSSPSPAVSPTASRRTTRPRASPCRGGVSSPRFAGGTRRGGRSPWTSQPPSGYLTGATADGRDRVPHDPDDRPRGLDRGLRHLSGPVTGDAGDRSSCTCAGPRGEVRWAGVSLDRDRSVAAANSAAGHGPLQAQWRARPRPTIAACTSP